ncbi:ABC transporter family substrate-binding protein [Pseudonocardia sp. NPDC046786]|uniref:ABC transporter family substrate-binding protein n=1 Tax=Pseudonocardia sp. NPDC046786 TaxID=3155471 RepID=UPI0033DA552C
MYRSARSGALTVSAAALTLVLAACGSGQGLGIGTGAELSTRPSFNEQPYENLRDGGTLRTAAGALNPQFNLFHASATSETRDLWEWYNPRLITFTPTGEAVVNPDYLTDATAELVGGSTRVTYTIDPRAVFNDGTPIDWRAFEATWRANNGSDPARTSRSVAIFGRIASITPGADDRQAVVTYDGVNVWWQGTFTTLLHPSAAGVDTFNTGYVNDPHPEWGAGPYTVGASDLRAGTITFERNPAWWGRPGRLDSRTFTVMEPQAAVNAFRNGELDATQVGNAEALAQAGSVPDAEIRISGTTAVSLVTLNSAAPMLSDPAVRRSVLEGIDRDQLVEIAFQGMDYTEELPGSLILQPYQAGYRDNLAEVLQFDPAAARSGLDAAGWAPGPDGIRVSGGERLTLSFVQFSDTPTGRAFGMALTAMMREIGVELQVRQVPPTEYPAVLAARDFDVVMSGLAAENPYGIATLCSLYCSDSSLNKSGTGNSGLDAELQAVGGLPTAEEQLTVANEVERVALANYGVLPLGSGPTAWATRPGLANVGASLFARPLPETVGWQTGS